MTSRTKCVLLVSGGIVLAVSMLQLAGLRINTTHSYPPGLYLKTRAPIEKGALVIFCPPDTPVFQEARSRGYIGSGFCPGGYEYMIKKILATSGDRVAFSPDGVAVNGAVLPNSKPMMTDAAGRALPHREMDVPALDENSVLLMSDYSVKSFDARYFGLVKKSAIISSIVPLWIW